MLGITFDPFHNSTFHSFYLYLTYQICHAHFHYFHHPFLVFTRQARNSSQPLGSLNFVFPSTLKSHLFMWLSVQLFHHSFPFYFHNYCPSFSSCPRDPTIYLLCKVLPHRIEPTLHLVSCFSSIFLHSAKFCIPLSIEFILKKVNQNHLISLLLTWNTITLFLFFSPPGIHSNG